MLKNESQVENIAPSVASADEALFRSLAKKKKKKRRKIIRTVIIILLLLAAGAAFAISTLKKKVTEQFMSSDEEVKSYTAETGSISTTVSGSGTLSNVDEETVSIPSGVKIEEVLVSSDDKVKKGDVLASLDLASVMNEMSAVQKDLDDLDAEIGAAGDKNENTYISAGVDGRIKKVYAQKDQPVLDCMVEHGALALLSLDGYMAVDIRTDALQSGDAVVVRRGDEKQTELNGVVDTVTTGTAVVLVTDNGPQMDEQVTVFTTDGRELGSGRLYIHSAIRITGISGTVSGIPATENTYVYSYSTVMYINDPSFDATYASLVKQRKDLEERLLSLLELYRNGALLSPMDGSVTAVSYDETAGSSTTATEDTDIVTLSPDKSMEVSISVDESHILSLALGQQAQISVNSIADETFTGAVTEINKTATSASGVTRYSAVVTLDKDSRMLSGMSAKVTVRIQGVDDAVIIPAAALHQTSSTSYVYTMYDEATHQYGGMVQVVTGISNSSYVEITEGLKPGDVVWYTEEESRSWGSFGGFGGSMPSGNFGGNMPAGDFSGGMPSGNFGGGNMPSGDFGGRTGSNGRTGNNGRSGGSAGGGMTGGGMPGGRN